MISVNTQFELDKMSLNDIDHFLKAVGDYRTYRHINEKTGLCWQDFFDEARDAAKKTKQRILSSSGHHRPTFYDLGVAIAKRVSALVRNYVNKNPTYRESYLIEATCAAWQDGISEEDFIERAAWYAAKFTWQNLLTPNTSLMVLNLPDLADNGAEND